MSISEQKPIQKKKKKLTKSLAKTTGGTGLNQQKNLKAEKQPCEETSGLPASNDTKDVTGNKDAPRIQNVKKKAGATGTATGRKRQSSDAADTKDVTGNKDAPRIQKNVKKKAGATGTATGRKRQSSDAAGNDPPKKRNKPGSGDAGRSSKISHQDGAPDWRQIRADAAEIKQRRKSHNKLFEVGKDMKKLWEEVRVERCSSERRAALLPQLAALVRGKVPQLVRAHDRARVCETLFQLGDQTLRGWLFAEVQHCVPELSRDKYARHFVLKVLAYGSSEQKKAVGETLRGVIPTLAGHRFGSEVVEAYFRDVASPETQQRMLMEFYGSEYFLAMEATRSLGQLLVERPERRVLLLTNLRSQLQSLLDKQLVTGSLVHRLLLEYLLHCPESDRAELVTALRLAVVQMLHTRDGARVGLRCLWWGTAKDRKAIVKSFKTHVLKVCTDEHGFLVMLAVLDTVDDTRLVSKALLEELLSQVVDAVATEPGRKVVQYLLAPRDPTYLHPAVVTELSGGDSNATSKKEPELRRRELLASVSEPLLKVASIHCLEWMEDASKCILLTHILTKCSGDSLRPALSQLARRAAQPVGSQSDDHLVNSAAAYMQLKKLVQADRQRADNVTEDDQKPVLFSLLVLNELTEEATLSWISTNRTAFLLVLMLETEAAAVVRAVADTLKPFSRKLKPTCKGAEILKKKLLVQWACDD